MQPFAPDLARDGRRAMGAIRAQGESERYWRINRYEGAFDGLDVEGLPTFWDTSVPLRERAPAIRAQLPKIAARRLVAMLFSDRAFPSVVVDAGYGAALDEAHTEALAALVSEIVGAARLPSVMRAVTMAALRSGTAVAVTGIRRGRPVVDLLPAKCCTPTFDADGVLTRVEYMQKVPAAGGKWVLHRRVITAQSDVVFAPVDVERITEHTDLDALPITSTRLLSFLPVVWARNAADASAHEPDGYPIHHGLLAEIGAADMECSQLYRTALYNGEPVMVRMGVSGDAGSAPLGPQGRTAAGAVGAEAEHGGASWGAALSGFVRNAFSGGRGGNATKKAPNIIWNLPAGSDAKLLESTGAGAQILTSAFDRHSRIITDAMGVILAQPGDMGGNAMSSRSLAIMFAPMLATVDEMRVTYGDVLRDLVGQLLRWCHVTAEGVHVRALAAARAALATMSVTLADGSSQWSTTALSLQWGEYFEPSWADVSAAIDAASKATGGRPVASQRAAMRLVAPVLGIDDINAEVSELDAELGSDTAAMKDALGTLAPKPDASASAPVEAVADTALNGAQVEALIALAERVSLRTLPLESAVRIAMRGFQLSDEEARAMLSPAAEAPPPSPPVTADGPSAFPAS